MRDADEKDIEFFKDPKLWPAWPMQSVKRRKGEHDIECGFIVAIKGKLTTVFLTNPWNVWSGEMKLEKAMEGPKKEYKDLDELLDDGWIID